MAKKSQRLKRSEVVVSEEEVDDSGNDSIRKHRSMKVTEGATS